VLLAKQPSVSQENKMLASLKSLSTECSQVNTGLCSYYDVTVCTPLQRSNQSIFAKFGMEVIRK